MADGDREVTPPSTAPGRRVGNPWGPEVAGPLDGFIHDVDFTRFDSRLGRWVPLALGAVVASVAANAGLGSAVVVGLGLAVCLGVVAIAFERDRWRAQDVIQWYQKDRQLRWIRDTGGPGPGGDPAAAEIWLGAHQPGSVPQIYRVLAAFQTGDAVVVTRELAALSDGVPEDRLWKLWVVETTRWGETGNADTTELERLVGTLPPSPDRAMFQSWLAAVEAMRRRTSGDRAWIQTLAGQRGRAARTPLGLRRRTRVWLSRFAVVVAFVVFSVVFSSVGLAISSRGDPIPAAYANTTYAIRGDLPWFDEQRVLRALPALERSLPNAVRSVDAALDDEAYFLAIDDSLPTFIWTTGGIDLVGPADGRGRRVWEIEVLLGGSGPTSSSAIVTFDGVSGPRYLYGIDPAVFAELRRAAGLPVGGSAP